MCLSKTTLELNSNVSPSAFFGTSSFSARPHVCFPNFRDLQNLDHDVENIDGKSAVSTFKSRDSRQYFAARDDPKARPGNQQSGTSRPANVYVSTLNAQTQKAVAQITYAQIHLKKIISYVTQMCCW